VSLGQSDNALLKLMGDKILQEENAALKAEVERLRKADRLVCWNPATEQWEPRLENKPCQPPQACE
jgi:uncharacterized protein with von Willebrand factor type A (vWA) domain